MTPPNQPFRTELIHRTCTKEMLLQPAELCNVSLFVCDCLRLLLRSSFNHHNCSAVWEEGHTFADFYLCREIWISNYRLCGFFFFLVTHSFSDAQRLQLQDAALQFLSEILVFELHGPCVCGHILCVRRRAVRAWAHGREEIPWLH